jgi:hypothetical protein
MSAESRQPVGKSELEQKYGFVHPAFGEYMAVLSHSALPDAERLLEFSENMRQTENPFVLMGAGWAAAEYAMFLGTRNAPPLPLDRRLDALSLAERRWEEAEESLTTHMDSTTDYLLQDEYLRRLLEIQLAEAALPSMKVIAGLYSNEPYSRGYTQAAIQDTMDETVEMAKIVLNMDEEDREQFRKTRTGVSNKALTFLTLQSGTPDYFILIPSPLPHQFHKKKNQQSDLFAIPFSREYNRRRIRITYHPEEIPTDDKLFTVVPQRDLAMRHGVQPIDTLDRFVTTYQTSLGIVSLEEPVQQLTRNLGRRLLTESLWIPPRR